MTDVGRTAAAPFLPPEPLHVAVVSEGEETVWVGVAATREELVRVLLADFVLPRAPYQLGDGARQRFQRLLHEGQVGQAVELYFERVGERWDPQRLTIVARHCAGGGTVLALQRAGDLAPGAV